MGIASAGLLFAVLGLTHSFVEYYNRSIRNVKQSVA